MVPTVAVHQLYGGGHITTHCKWPGSPFAIIIVNYPGEPSAGGTECRGNRVQGEPSAGGNRVQGGRTSAMAHL